MFFGWFLGIYNLDNGTTSFYNGIIKSNNDTDISSMITNVRDGYKIAEETDGDYVIAYLKEKIGSGEYDPAKGVNTPKLSDGMIPIKWDSGNSTWVICKEDDPEWYNYVDQTSGQDGQSMWANVMLGDGTYKTAEGNVGKEVGINDLGSMYVWIPRYAYAITSGYHSSTAGDIQIAFLEGTKAYPVGTQISYKYQGTIGTGSITNASGQGNWNEHPAFNFGGTTLAGIWVAKFEAGKNENKVKVLPNIDSWSFISISSMFKVCREMQTKYNTTYGISNDNNIIDTHMIKNSEWGATAYLTQSSYGRNKHEVEKNDTSDITGGKDGYKNNISQSTTGNIAGIYDMSGGKDEYVSAYLDNEAISLKNEGKELLGRK